VWRRSQNAHVFLGNFGIGNAEKKILEIGLGVWFAGGGTSRSADCQQNSAQARQDETVHGSPRNAQLPSRSRFHIRRRRTDNLHQRLCLAELCLCLLQRQSPLPAPTQNQQLTHCIQSVNRREPMKQRTYAYLAFFKGLSCLLGPFLADCERAANRPGYRSRQQRHGTERAGPHRSQHCYFNKLFS